MFSVNPEHSDPTKCALMISFMWVDFNYIKPSNYSPERYFSATTERHFVLQTYNKHHTTSHILQIAEQTLTT